MKLKLTLTAEEQERVSKLLNKELAELNKKLALAQLANIQRRVSQGLGLDGKMKPYSKSYSKIKKEAGRRVNVRNLEFTGRMLSDMGISEIDDGVYVIHFLTAQQRLKALSNQMREAWFGITDEERNMLMKLAKKEVEK